MTRITRIKRINLCYLCHLWLKYLDGKLAVYDLATMEKRDEFIFTRPISMLRFSQDGKRLFVLTTAQTVYILDVSSLAKT
ncbi:MAG TPA: hypothetical protein VKB05_11690 [Pyrinomonadaceae bacterium]|nr:hypothetical protein [Pyrinomonadaceae bacterium]